LAALMVGSSIKFRQNYNNYRIIKGAWMGNANVGDIEKKIKNSRNIPIV